MTMSVVNKTLLELVMMLLSLLTDVNGNSQFSRVGDNVILPCNNVVYSNCSSTTWNYNRAGAQTTIEEVNRGNVKKDNRPDRSDRLSLGSNCSLHVNDVRVEDAGIYTCQQFLTMGGKRQGQAEVVYLSLLHLSSPTPVTELKPGETVTLNCTLYTFNGKCNSYITSNVTVNLYETGTDLEKDFRLNIPNPPRCEITLNVTLQKKDNNRKWTCQLIKRGAVMTFIDFLVTLSGSPSQNQIPMAVGVAVGVALCVFAAVIIVHKRRTKKQKTAEVRIVNNNDLGLNAVNYSTPPANEDTSVPAENINCGIAYATINHFNQNLPQRVNAHGEEAVTYASVMTPTDKESQCKPADPCSLYATVN